MTLLSAALEALAGPLLRWVTIPALILAALTFGKVAWDKRDARLLREGEQICDARWREAVRESEQRAADGRVRAAESLLEVERETGERLRDELDSIRAEMEKLRSAARPADSRCVSDDVLDAAKRQPAEAAGEAAKPNPRRRPARSPAPSEKVPQQGGGGIGKIFGF